jgi:hypothetical protein
MQSTLSAFEPALRFGLSTTTVTPSNLLERSLKTPSAVTLHNARSQPGWQEALLTLSLQRQPSPESLSLVVIHFRHDSELTHTLASTPGLDNENGTDGESVLEPSGGAAAVAACAIPGAGGGEYPAAAPAAACGKFAAAGKTRASGEEGNVGVGAVGVLCGSSKGVGVGRICCR